MRVVVALGGNALLRRGERPTAAAQGANVKRAARALARLAGQGHALVVSHGNGPQVGLLALRGDAGPPDEADPLDLLGAETEGMIGYLIERELRNVLPAGQRVATLLTQVEVDPKDPALRQPTKPIGPVYGKAEAARLAAARGWTVARDGAGYRRVVASPMPRRILEGGVIALLVDSGVIVICAGGGGIPVVVGPDGGLVGVEAVIDKDHASALLARGLRADALLLLTDVDAVHADWGSPAQRPIRRADPAALRRHVFETGTMAPKVAAACAFVAATGGTAGIGRLDDAAEILAGQAGTTVAPDRPDPPAGVAGAD